MIDSTISEVLPESLKEFIASGKKTFRCDDGDWKVAIEHPTPTYTKKHLPTNSLIIANNECGDILFLKSVHAQDNDISIYGTKVYVYWHEGPGIEIFAEDLSSLTNPADPIPSDQGPVYYSDGATQILVGDHVNARNILFRHEGRVVYVPGISKRNRELEHGGLAWVGIRFESGSLTGTLVDPETFCLKKSVKFLSRATTAVEEIDPYDDLE
jgi:hypothetical protein